MCISEYGWIYDDSHRSKAGRNHIYSYIMLEGKSCLGTGHQIQAIVSRRLH